MYCNSTTAGCATARQLTSKRELAVLVLPIWQSVTFCDIVLLQCYCTLQST